MIVVRTSKKNLFTHLSPVIVLQPYRLPSKRE
jgi:hypothetical protein